MSGSGRFQPSWTGDAPPLPPRPSDLGESMGLAHRTSVLGTVPPPVPSTPRPSRSTAAGQEPTVSDALRYPDQSESFTLPELVDKHQNLFPIKVVVVKGHYGDRGEDSAIATNEVYNIHFIKKSKVFTVKDDFGYKYIVPLNSACRFGLYYQKGTCYFDTIEDVIKASPLPKVIAAQTAHYGGSEKNSVLRLEILVVKGINKGRIGKKPTLTVFSISKKEEKQLRSDVLGRFTTDPSYTYMYLTDLVKYLPYEFPLVVHLYPDYDTDEPESTYLSSDKMKIINEFVETCVVTTPIIEGEDEDDEELNEHVVDIPLSLPIEVSVLPPKDDSGGDDYEQLYETTRNLISGYNPLLGKTYRDTTDDYSYTTQTQIFSSVRKGFESEGLNIQMPQTISQSRLPPGQSAAASNRHSAGSYEDIDEFVPGSRDVYEEMDVTDGPPQGFIGRPGSTMLEGQRPPYQSPTRRVYRSESEYCNSPSSSAVSPSKSFNSGFNPSHTIPNTHPVPPRSSAPSVPPRLSSKSFRDTPLSSTSSAKTSPPVAPKKPKKPKPRSSSSSTDGVFLVDRQSTTAESPKVPSKMAVMQDAIDTLTSRMQSLETTAQEGAMLELTQQLQTVFSLTQSLQATCSSLSEEVAALRADVEGLRAQVKDTSKPTDNQGLSGNSSLQALTCDQVGALLEAMGPSLACYKEVFFQELIDGDLLSQCTDEILENELGIKSRLDRMKLMQVVKGNKSVEKILQGSYVKFEFNGKHK